MANVHIQKTAFADKDMIYSWLDEPHTQEFWDNSQGHRDDIVNFMHGRKTCSEYFGGSNTYWLGLKGDAPFMFTQKPALKKLLSLHSKVVILKALKVC